MLGAPLVPILESEPFNYLGSINSQAAYLHFPKVIPAMEAQLNRMPAELRALHEANFTRIMYARDIPPVVQVP